MGAAAATRKLPKPKRCLESEWQQVFISFRLDILFACVQVLFTSVI